MVIRYIAIEFDDEVGKDKRSWKGGCLSCSYNLLPNETPEECIRRMEKEVESGTVSVRSRDNGEQGAMPVDEFIAKLQDEIKNRK